VSSFIEIPPLSEEISSHSKYVLTGGRTAHLKIQCFRSRFFDGGGMTISTQGTIGISQYASITI